MKNGVAGGDGGEELHDDSGRGPKRPTISTHGVLEWVIVFLPGHSVETGGVITHRCLRIATKPEGCDPLLDVPYLFV